MVYFLLVGENILVNTEQSGLMQHWFIFLLVLDRDIHQLFLVEMQVLIMLPFFRAQALGSGGIWKEIFAGQGSSYGIEKSLISESLFSDENYRD